MANTPPPVKRKKKAAAINASGNRYITEMFGECLDKGGVIGTILMDLSKAYDCLPHDLLIAKLEAYGFDNNSLHLLYNYLTNRKQRVNIGSYFSEWLAILIGVPQGSILGPIFI